MLSQRGMGAEVLREVAGVAKMATRQVLREVRRDDRPPLSRHRRLLRSAQQGLSLEFVEGLNSRIRVLRSAPMVLRRGIPQGKAPDLYASGALIET
jgi:hypothetical protein